MNRSKRVLMAAFILLTMIMLVFAYAAWHPGRLVRDGRHDLRTNAIWLQHGWMGDDDWFQRNKRDKSRFRDARQMARLASKLRFHGIKYVFPHVCPCQPDGKIARHDEPNTEIFLDQLSDLKVIPWVGGIVGTHCFIDSREWRSRFIASILDLFARHPRLAGVQVNIEPMISGDTDFLDLLQELRQAMPRDKILSIAAYPPPTKWHPFPRVHWGRKYYQQVAQHADQIAVMMYDSAIRLQKVYQKVMSAWTRDVLTWGQGTEILLGVPVYDDATVLYHSPKVENIQNALFGIHAGLLRFESLPENYRGLAVYSEWEMDDEEWCYLNREFGKEELE